MYKGGNDRFRTGGKVVGSFEGRKKVIGSEIQTGPLRSCESGVI